MDEAGSLVLGVGDLVLHNGQEYEVLDNYLQVDTPKGAYFRVLCRNASCGYVALSGSQAYDAAKAYRNRS